MKKEFLIQVIGYTNGAGLSKDIDLILYLIKEMNIPIKYIPPFKSLKKELPYIKYKFLKIFKSSIFKKFFLKKNAHTQIINIFLEHIDEYYISDRSINCFIPNPEWCKDSDIKLLSKIDYILCKTVFTQHIFDRFSMNTYYIGFTSDDRKDETISHKSETFFHLAGSSAQKGTDILVNLWLKHPEWPYLTVVQNPKLFTKKDPIISDNINYIVNYLDDNQLKKLQNENLFHLCPSEAEGFGHYIAEAISCGAITLTTDAPPMNELIDSSRGILVKYKSTKPQRLGINYYIDEQELEIQITRMLQMTNEEKVSIQEKSRAWFLSNDQNFKIRFKAFITMITKT